MRRSRAPIWVVVLPFVAGCHGGTFVVEPSLAVREADVVAGPRVSACVAQGTPTKTAIEKLAEGTTVTLGTTTLVAARARIETEAREDIPAHVHDDLAALRKQVAIVPDVDRMLAAIDALARVPQHLTENASFTFVVTDAGASPIVGRCTSVNTADSMGFFQPPNFTVRCRMVPEDGEPADLAARGSGSWANYRFDGDIVRGASRWSLASQNVSVMGAGGIRGFDIRTGGQQIGAVSFMEEGPLDDDHHMTIVAKAWRAPRATKAEDELLAASLALAYVYPWPSDCDRAAIAGRMKTPARE